MKVSILAWALLAVSLISGCGSYVPEIQEFYESKAKTPIKVAAIVSHIQCEIQHSVQSEVIKDMQTAELAAKQKPPLNQGRSLTWFDGYAAQMTLNLTMEETGGVNAGLSFNHPFSNAITNVDSVAKTSVTTSQNASLGLAAAYSTKATRKETLSLFVPFQPFLTTQAIATERAARANGKELDCNKAGGAFIEGDLKLQDWLDDVLLTAYSDPQFGARLEAEQKASKKDAIQHEVTFVITANGSMTPSWKLVRVAGNQGNTPFLSGQRARTQDVIITMAKNDNGALPQVAQNVLLASQLRNAVQGF